MKEDYLILENLLEYISEYKDLCVQFEFKAVLNLPKIISMVKIAWIWLIVIENVQVVK